MKYYVEIFNVVQVGPELNDIENILHRHFILDNVNDEQAIEFCKKAIEKIEANDELGNEYDYIIIPWKEFEQNLIDNGKSLSEEISE